MHRPIRMTAVPLAPESQYLFAFNANIRRYLNVTVFYEPVADSGTWYVRVHMSGKRDRKQDGGSMWVHTCTAKDWINGIIEARAYCQSLRTNRRKMKRNYRLWHGNN